MADETNPIPLVMRNDQAAHSGDVAADNIAALKALFPAIVTDGKVDFDVLRQLLGDAVESGTERYGLNWKGKSRARAFALTPSTGTLRPAKADSRDWDETKNIVVEGDNLEVLKLLRKSYAGKIKLIYIDPPYNTGNDFVYPDDYTDSLVNYELMTGQRAENGARLTTNKENSGRFHTAWLNMMYPRLMLSNELLREDGLYIVSVDDAEVDNVSAILNEILGEENHIATLIWDKNRKNDAKLFSVGHEYMLVYCKSKDLLKERNTRWRESKNGIEEARELFETLKIECGEDWETIRKRFSTFYRALDASDLRKPIGRFTKLCGRGPFRDDGDISWPGGGGPKYEVLHPKTKKPVKIPAGGWVYPTAQGFWEAYDRGFVTFGPDESTLPRQMRYLFESDGQVMISVNFSYAQTATLEFIELMGARVFENPKNYRDIARLLAYLQTNDGIILDFFAGSGTTGHAVMAQNAADGGNRRYIMVQLPEPLDATKAEQKTAADFCDKLGKPRTIAELTKERLRRAGDKVKADNLDAEIDTGFRVYKLATSNLKPWQPGYDLAADLLDATSNVLPGRSEDDLLVELLLKTGIDLALSSETRTIAGRTVHSLGGGTLIVCLADIPAAQARALGDGIADWLDELSPPAPTTFFFKDSGFDAGGNCAAAARANLAATLRQRRGDNSIEKLGAV